MTQNIISNQTNQTFSNSQFSQEDLTIPTSQSLINPDGSAKQLLAKTPKRPNHALFRLEASIQIAKQSQLNTTIISPSEMDAQKLLKFTLENSSNTAEFKKVFNEAIELGKDSKLGCLFESAEFEDIIDHPERYDSVHDVIEALESKKNKLINCLSISQKLIYGPRILTFVNQLDKQLSFLEIFNELFSDLKAVLIGEGAVQILSFFFRPDRNDKSAFETLNSFIKKLNSSE